MFFFSEDLIFPIWNSLYICRPESLRFWTSCFSICQWPYVGVPLHFETNPFYCCPRLCLTSSFEAPLFCLSNTLFHDGIPNLLRQTFVLLLIFVAWTWFGPEKLQRRDRDNTGTVPKVAIDFSGMWTRMTWQYVYNILYRINITVYLIVGHTVLPV